MIRAQTAHAPSRADWALPDDEVGADAVVVPLRDAVLDPEGARRAHCPVCGDEQPMQVVVTSGGVRYDYCVGCGLLWHVDRDLDVVVGSRLVMAPHHAGGRS